MANVQPKTQHHLYQALQHLSVLDILIVTLYLIHITRTPNPSTEDLILRIPTARRLINQAYTSRQKGIKQVMTTAKLITVRRPQSRIPKLTKRKVKCACRIQHDTNCVTYCDTFNTINSTLVKYVTLKIILQQTNTTILTVNYSHIALLNNIIHNINDIQRSLNKKLYTLTHEIRILTTHALYRSTRHTPPSPCISNMITRHPPSHRIPSLSPLVVQRIFVENTYTFAR